MAVSTRRRPFNNCTADSAVRSGNSWLVFPANGDLYHIGLGTSDEFRRRFPEPLLISKPTDGGVSW